MALSAILPFYHDIGGILLFHLHAPLLPYETKAQSGIWKAKKEYVVVIGRQSVIFVGICARLCIFWCAKIASWRSRSLSVSGSDGVLWTKQVSWSMVDLVLNLHYDQLYIIRLVMLYNHKTKKFQRHSAGFESPRGPYQGVRVSDLQKWWSLGYEKWNRLPIWWHQIQEEKA